MNSHRVYVSKEVTYTVHSQQQLQLHKRLKHQIEFQLIDLIAVVVAAGSVVHYWFVVVADCSQFVAACFLYFVVVLVVYFLEKFLSSLLIYSLFLLNTT